MKSNVERNGKKFVESEFWKARDLCITAVDKILESLSEGMTEKDGQALIEEVLQSMGSKKRWHPNKFRIGVDSLKTFRDKPDDDIKLVTGDLVFVDVGPVFGDHEADIGRTCVFNSSDQDLVKLQQGAEEVFLATQAAWRSDKLSGEALYKVAATEAEMRGYELSLDMAGHRLSDFPHALISRDNLSGRDFVPTENLWVLEIHIRSQALQQGSFFEDLLRS